MQKPAQKRIKPAGAAAPTAKTQPSPKKVKAAPRVANSSKQGRRAQDDSSQPTAAAATEGKLQKCTRLSVFRSEEGDIFHPGDSAYVVMDADRFDEDAEMSEPCEVCGHVEKADELGEATAMLECNTCLRGFHTSCLSPPLQQVPKVRVERASSPADVAASSRVCSDKWHREWPPLASTAPTSMPLAGHGLPER